MHVNFSFLICRGLGALVLVTLMGYLVGGLCRLHDHQKIIKDRKAAKKEDDARLETIRASRAEEDVRRWKSRALAAEAPNRERKGMESPKVFCRC